MTMLIILLAILPGVAISYWIVKADRYEKESKIMLGVAFLLGILVTYPTMKAEAWAATLNWENSHNFFKIFFFSLIFVGLTEELAKFICLGIPYFRKEFNEPLDGIVYSVLIAMGFATCENVLYALDYGLQTTALRAFTAVPAHGAFAVIMGYYVGLSKFNKRNQIGLLLIGLGLASLVHGIYDFFILQPYAEWLMSLATVVLLASLIFAYRLLKKHQQASPFRPNDELETATAPAATTTPIADAAKLTPNPSPEDDNDVLFAAFDKKLEEE